MTLSFYFSTLWRKIYEITALWVWKLQKFTFTHLWQKFVKVTDTKEITEELIWRNIFSERVNFFFHIVQSGNYVTIFPIFQISFAIPQEAVHGRVALLVILILCLLTLFINVTERSPNAKNSTSISNWILTCISFVYGAFFEYGCILLYKNVSTTYVIQDYIEYNLKILDLCCFSASVLCFSTFNIIFWYFSQRSS